ncbi:MAG TPA: hypothetical protein VKA08_02325 [Balneolales bacterium]|nr:hypothetical protein [Balneolales bacterium]
MNKPLKEGKEYIGLKRFFLKGQRETDRTGVGMIQILASVNKTVPLISLF